MNRQKRRRLRKVKGDDRYIQMLEEENRQLRSRDNNDEAQIWKQRYHALHEWAQQSHTLTLRYAELVQYLNILAVLFGLAQGVHSKALREALKSHSESLAAAMARLRNDTLELQQDPKHKAFIDDILSIASDYQDAVSSLLAKKQLTLDEVNAIRASFPHLKMQDELADRVAQLLQRQRGIDPAREYVAQRVLEQLDDEPNLSYADAGLQVHKVLAQRDIHDQNAALTFRQRRQREAFVWLDGFVADRRRLGQEVSRAVRDFEHQQGQSVTS